ncbi:hypothetical protein [Bacteroides timonensis]|uniref:hypothetical protein n=1 Tax=Bacteroides timonensis TaxID=1470345 RepID=UPI0004BB8DC3|nr:hypothetical protein [Bacteroides timonensis]
MKQQLLAGNLSALLALTFMSQPLPTCTLIPKSRGLSEIDLKKRYKEINDVPGIRQGEKVIEARVSGRTLSFLLRDGFCVAGYCFDDKDDF